MKQIIFSLLILLSIYKSANCQSWGDSSIANGPIFYSVEENPKFPGGMHAYYKFFSDSLRMPNNFVSIASNRLVTVQIYIDKTGKIVYAKIERSVNKDYDEVALELIKKMPSWSPGIQNGHPVPTTLEIPIRFID